MEQIKIDSQHSVELLDNEKKRIYLAVAIGCLNTIHNAIPGPPHRKQKRVLRQFGEQLNRQQYGFTKVSDVNLQLFQDHLVAAGTILDQVLEETEQAGLHVMLNLTGFCLKELPLSQRYYERYDSLFTFWEGVHKSDDIESGNQIFQRIDAEVQKRVAQRSGITL